MMTRSMQPPERERGVILLMTLIMIVALSLLAVSAIERSTINLQIVENVQSRQRVSAAAQAGIEQVLNEVENFKTPAAQAVTIDGLTVNLSAPECIGVRTASGYSAKKIGSNVVASPEDTLWSVTSAVTDPASGAEARLRQGVQIRFTAGQCP